ncbi:ParB-like nuclease domain protein [Labrenzia sp. THAF35]|uniref:ParB N-terminal domain-containing protein n=1 Tax=Labrenzia sp. THAF35 TaxID=2587854 RepID=UPI001267A491|nr:ParB N-terminal domain-containing protein [Labrenzia sp. THAF35]QFT65961.1 ParB-like nuclease domain protein [Labrenzia sp. THAF35]
MADTKAKPTKKLSYKRLPVKVENLFLDLENPRFGLKEVDDPNEALSMLVERANLRELWDSISSQGWLELEPMVCIKGEAEDTYTVIEGNRRLAAIQTLRDPEILEARLRSRVPTLDKEIRDELNEIEIVVVDDRRDADAFIGFKHVNGPTSWGSLPKAKFASDMFERLVKQSKDPDAALKSVTDALGDTTTSMLRMLVGFEVLEQAINENIIETEQIEGKSFDFSHLYTMMPNPATREFLGWGPNPLRADNIKPNPVSAENRSQLKYLIGWLFGTKDVERVIQAQGTDRPKLQKVLAHRAATETLIATGSLEHASTKAGLDVDAWRDRLIKAETQAKSLMNDLSDIQSRLLERDVQDSVERADNLKRTYNHISILLKSSDEY